MTSQPKKRSGIRLSPALRKKKRGLQSRLGCFERVLLAYSGGTDSSLLLTEAVEALGSERVLAVTAVSAFFPLHEKKMAQSICKRLKVEHCLLKTEPLKSKKIIRNTDDRCYHCKHHFLERLIALAKKRGIPVVLEASQKDDHRDYRPGARAVAEFGVLSPLVEAGLNKEEVRRLSRFHGLPTADTPAAACLASRVPYGTEITYDLLVRLGKAEETVRKLGFSHFRVRHHGSLARLEFAPGEMERAFQYRRSLTRRVQTLGWNYVTLDLTGYRQGSLNELL